MGACLVGGLRCPDTFPSRGTARLESPTSSTSSWREWIQGPPVEPLGAQEAAGRSEMFSSRQGAQVPTRAHPCATVTPESYNCWGKPASPGRSDSHTPCHSCLRPFLKTQTQHGGRCSQPGFQGLLSAAHDPSEESVGQG